MSNSGMLEKPSKVSTAVKLLYGTLGIGIMRSAIESSSLTEAAVAFVIFAQFFVFGFLLLLIYMIEKGKNWARITFLVLFILGVPLFILPMIQSLTTHPISGVLGLLQIVMQVIGLILLFQGSSSAWFKATKNLKNENALQGDPSD